MLDPALNNFFSTLKKNWHKKKIKASMAKDKKDELIKECDDFYNLKHWIPFAAENAIKRALSSHPSKFSHPDVGASMTNVKKRTYVSPIIFEGEYSNDGFLLTGNVKNVDLDSTGNGAEVGAIGEIGALLSLKLTDGRRFFKHLEENSFEAKKLLDIDDIEYKTLRNGLLAMVKQDENMVTSSKIKQVYFPVQDNEYHQLSILTPSGIVFDLRKRLDNMRFGDEIKECRERRKNHQAGDSFKEIYDLTTIGYGGTKPQNISVLNNANGGKAHLFLSMPPTLETRKVNFPTKDFFTQNMYYGQSIASFKLLHSFYLQRKNNMNERARRDALYQDVIDDIIENMHHVRSVASEQYIASHSLLNVSQRIWLQVIQAPQDDDWLDDILKHVTQFIFHGYEKMLDKRAIKLGDAEYQHIEKIVDANKEVLR